MEFYSYIQKLIGFRGRRIVADTKVFPIGWHVITAASITGGEIRTGIELKIPSEFKECWGILVSATRNGLDTRANIIGELTLHFNNKELNPAQRIAIRVKPLSDLAGSTGMRRKYDVLRLKEPLKRGMIIQAEYKDTSALGAGYDLKIYLKGARDNK